MKLLTLKLNEELGLKVKESLKLRVEILLYIFIIEKNNDIYII